MATILIISWLPYPKMWGLSIQARYNINKRGVSHQSQVHSTQDPPVPHQKGMEKWNKNRIYILENNQFNLQIIAIMFLFRWPSSR